MMKSILDRSFRYTPSIETDLRKTFARLRRQQLAPKATIGVNTAHLNVVPIARPRLRSN